MKWSSDIPISMSHIRSGVEEETIPPTYDNFGSSGSSHHVMSDETPPSPRTLFDSSESNPVIAKAELSIYSTPHIRDYKEAVNSTLKRIELTCASDFNSMCAGAADVAWPFIGQISFALRKRKILFHDRPLFRSEAAIGKQTVSNRETILVDRQGEEDNASQVYKNLRGKNDASRHEVNSIVGNVDGNDWDVKGEMNHMKRKGEDGLKHRDELYAPNPNSEHHYPLEPWSPFIRDKEDSEDEGNHRGHNDHDGRRGPDQPHVMDDYLYVGSLGYGDAGDMCMYDNFQKLAAPCQSFVFDLNDLRQQFWKEESIADYRPVGPGVFAFLLVNFLMYSGILEYFRYLSRKKNRYTEKDAIATLTLIDADPTLKSQLDAEADISLTQLGGDRGALTVLWARLSRIVVVSYALFFFVASDGLLASQLVKNNQYALSMVPCAAAVIIIPVYGLLMWRLYTIAIPVAISIWTERYLSAFSLHETFLSDYAPILEFGFKASWMIVFPMATLLLYLTLFLTFLLVITPLGDFLDSKYRYALNIMSYAAVVIQIAVLVFLIRRGKQAVVYFVGEQYVSDGTPCTVVPLKDA